MLSAGAFGPPRGELYQERARDIAACGKQALATLEQYLAEAPENEKRTKLQNSTDRVAKPSQYC